MSAALIQPGQLVFCIRRVNNRFLTAIAIPPNANTGYDYVRHKQHVQNATVQSNRISSACFEIGFGSCLAHSALSIRQKRKKKSKKGRQQTKNIHLGKHNDTGHNRLFKNAKVHKKLYFPTIGTNQHAVKMRPASHIRKQRPGVPCAGSRFQAGAGQPAGFKCSAVGRTAPNNPQHAAEKNRLTSRPLHGGHRKETGTSNVGWQSHRRTPSPEPPVFFEWLPQP